MTIDDILDADVDALVERTKNRVLPRGDITMARAWLFFAIQSVVGAALAYAILKPYTYVILTLRTCPSLTSIPGYTSRCSSGHCS